MKGRGRLDWWVLAAGVGVMVLGFWLATGALIIAGWAMLLLALVVFAVRAAR